MIGTARFLRPRSRFPVLALQRWLSEDSSAKKISRNLLKAKPTKRGTRTWVSRCRGCGGALFSPHVPINVEGESWDGLHRASNSEGSTRADICARCQLLRGGHLLKALEASNELDPTTFVNMLRPLHDMTVGAVMVVSAIDFEGTYIESIRELIGKNPLILAVTKIDLICNTSNLKNVEILRRYFRSRAAAMKFSVLDVVPVSGVTGVGVDNLKSLLENTGIFKTADVYIVGAANVGKSTLVNCLKERFLGNQPRKRGAFAAEKNMESVDLTTSSLPGTTLALTKVGLLAKQNALYDTPGILKNMYRHPSTKENLHQIKRLPSVALSVELNNTIVIGDDVLHVDLVSLERSLDAINSATSIVWRSVSKQTVKVVEHRDSRRRQLEMSIRAHAERQAANKRSEELRSNFYGNESEDARMETEDTLELTSDDLDSWDLLSVPHANATRMHVTGKADDVFAEAALETKIQISHELLRTAIVPRLDEDGYKAYSCDIAVPGFGFLAIRSALPLYVRVFGPAEMRCMIRPQLPVDDIPVDDPTSGDWKLQF